MAQPCAATHRPPALRRAPSHTRTPIARALRISPSLRAVAVDPRTAPHPRPLGLFMSLCSRTPPRPELRGAIPGRQGPAPPASPDPERDACSRPRRHVRHSSGASHARTHGPSRAADETDGRRTTARHDHHFVSAPPLSATSRPWTIGGTVHGTHAPSRRGWTPDQPGDTAPSLALAPRVDALCPTSSRGGGGGGFHAPAPDARAHPRRPTAGAPSVWRTRTQAGGPPAHTRGAPPTTPGRPSPIVAPHRAPWARTGAAHASSEFFPPRTGRAVPAALSRFLSGRRIPVQTTRRHAARLIATHRRRAPRPPAAAHARTAPPQLDAHTHSDDTPPPAARRPPQPARGRGRGRGAAARYRFRHRGSRSAREAEARAPCIAPAIRSAYVPDPLGPTPRTTTAAARAAPARAQDHAGGTQPRVPPWRANSNFQRDARSFCIGRVTTPGRVLLTGIALLPPRARPE
ncbi:hypothetical protein HYPSUDRAFT_215203 [Hypholoma sublateritium FD-334 SS-4]|uniref:Uncharacterized protein n=1 Tax=Hypholoma sublateritium (strain FD-334 SS-4) TaxID=945553 RepID=A0A0D2NX77_HYPSF|nr:hypothetical protein HYPSUDRAFT_215203 [Hypholoma sublateritium FD-334 SS-4]